MERARDALNRFFNLYNLQAGRDWSEFFSGWVKLVGEDLASHTRVFDVKNGALIVEVDHPGWMQLLQLRRQSVLAEVGRRYPQLGIRSMQMRLVREPIRTTSQPAEAARPAAQAASSPPPATPSAGSEALPPVETTGSGDTELKDLLDRLEKAVDKRRRELT
jgi:hypothetical protein